MKNLKKDYSLKEFYHNNIFNNLLYFPTKAQLDAIFSMCPTSFSLGNAFVYLEMINMYIFLIIL